MHSNLLSALPTWVTRRSALSTIRLTPQGDVANTLAQRLAGRVYWMVGVASIWATVLLGFGTWPIASAKAYDRLSSGDMASREYRPKAAKITMGGLPPRELGRQRRTASSYREVYRDKNYNADPHYGIPGTISGAR